MKVETEQIKWNGTITLKYHKPDCQLMLLSSQGKTDDEIYQSKNTCNCDGASYSGKNLVMLNGLYSIIDKLIDITNTDQNNGFISYMEIGLSSNAAANTQSALVLPSFRKFMNSATRSGTNAVYGAFYSGVQANTNSSLVATGTSTTVFDVTSGDGVLFDDGQTIQVGSEVGVISTVVSDTITLTNPLTATPIIGTTVDQCIAEIGLFGGSSASSTIGTGILFARTVSFTPEPKPAAYGATIEWAVALT